MDTNYYVHPKGGSPVHLGKSSATWAFSFRAYPPGEHEPGMPPFAVLDYTTWLRMLDLGDIYDEYGTQLTRRELLGRIDATRGGRSVLHGDDFRDAEGNCFTPVEFS